MPENPENYLPEVCTILTICKNRRKCPPKRSFLSVRSFFRFRFESALQAITGEMNGIAAHSSCRSFFNLAAMPFFSIIVDVFLVACGAVHPLQLHLPLLIERTFIVLGGGCLRIAQHFGTSVTIRCSCFCH